MKREVVIASACCGSIVASFSGHSQILLCSCGREKAKIKSGSGLGMRLEALLMDVLLPCLQEVGSGWFNKVSLPGATLLAKPGRELCVCVCVCVCVDGG